MVVMVLVTLVAAEVVLVVLLQMLVTQMVLMAVLVNEVLPARKVFDAMNAIESYKRLRVATVDQAEAEKVLTVKRAEAEAERTWDAK